MSYGLLRSNWRGAPAPTSRSRERAYEENATRPLALTLEFVPVAQPKTNRVNPWKYDRGLYKR